MIYILRSICGYPIGAYIDKISAELNLVFYLKKTIINLLDECEDNILDNCMVEVYGIDVNSNKKLFKFFNFIYNETSVNKLIKIYDLIQTYRDECGISEEDSIDSKDFIVELQIYGSIIPKITDTFSKSF